MATRGSWKFPVLLGAAALLLLGALATGLFVRGPWAWSVGLVYVAYDTWLLSYMLRASQLGLRESVGLFKPTNPEETINSLQSRPTLAVLIAARNERAALPATLEALLAQGDQPEQILVIDDGSTDATLSMLARDFAVAFAGKAPLGRSARFPNLRVLKKENSGKPRSLNLALAHVEQDLVCTLDADTVVEPAAVAAFRRAFAEEPKLWAACGILAPHCRGSVSAPAFELYQTFEYLRGFLWRLAWTRDHTLLLISGAFAAFRRAPLVEAGAFDPSSRVEDYELLFRLHRLSCDEGRFATVRVIPGARAVTDAPAHAANFLRQRRRWFAGFIETMFRHHDMVGNPKYGRLGSFHLLVKTLDTLLPLYGLAAVAALIAILALGKSIDRLVLIALVAKLVFDLACHFVSMVLYRRWLSQPLTARFVLRSIFSTATEPFGFQLLRQTAALLGWLDFLRGNIDWHPQRAPLSEHEPASAREQRRSAEPLADV